MNIHTESVIPAVIFADEAEWLKVFRKVKGGMAFLPDRHFAMMVPR